MTNSFKIQVIDDSKVSRSFLHAELSQAGYDVIECESGRVAAENFSLDLDLIVLDVTMPHFDGFETCRAIRIIEETLHKGDEFTLVPIILVSAKDNMESRNKGFLAGATDYIVKADLRDHLVPTVNRILQPQVVFSGMTALIAEDSKTARDLLIHHISSVGIASKAFPNGSEAFEELQRNPEPYDILLTDLVMPEMDGIELCQNVRVKLGKKDMPIIVLTSEDCRTTLKQAFEAGASDYLNKPYLKEELLARISSHINFLNQRKKLKKAVGELEAIHESKNQLLAACSHDLKAPLAAITGYTQLIMEDNDDLPPSLVKDLGSILKCVDVQTHLIQDIAALTKLEHTKNDMDTKVLQLDKLFNSVLEPMTKLATIKNIKLTATFHPNARVNGNESALIRLFHNLSSNAIKFTPQDGNISISLVEADGGFLQLSVEDSGIGIPEDKIETIFQPFSEASRPGTQGETSTGLGLSICKQITDVHGGSISVESEIGKGSIFTVFLPKAKDVAKKDDLAA
ncbi:sensor histidine kinase [Pseudobacteriovorax antillogorgiicola]|uniref:histidine kinase n=1 Tax=Pseudobacteriovorax antillogorgiicola TaxID=1513793 RepID=A0A1Y6BJC2_9BACT|nr:response regulator [Pseudobacteriovorax antillogorgiicola]TCS56398.1 signal transduction histidine kinase [Pseudobacteriovorax antillogorgiicola]SMF06125.1 Signal transduction histidine kinase [Pseudobacteriovorax antillogorgiicola]